MYINDTHYLLNTTYKMDSRYVITDLNFAYLSHILLTRKVCGRSLLPFKQITANDHIVGNV